MLGHSSDLSLAGADHFQPQLATDLSLTAPICSLLRMCGDWSPERDVELKTLLNLITRTHRGEKLIVFSQFADTVHYLTTQLHARGVPRLAAVTGDTEDPTRIAYETWREHVARRQRCLELRDKL